MRYFTFLADNAFGPLGGISGGNQWQVLDTHINLEQANAVADLFNAKVAEHFTNYPEASGHGSNLTMGVGRSLVAVTRGQNVNKVGDIYTV